ncbi:hypothetical protein [Streptomyces sp. NBC_00059]|uniref:hypothetical protein n=1 Tax=Streptomyces sp. NBC_00059 TaxID=2975635 RepID=UPI00224E7994|nr:hypothetical protein [Streptomyces sp. NBC_00059]MCX5416099.1 hypothetical protein [Streptomyces sp. NBC_00059]
MTEDAGTGGFHWEMFTSNRPEHGDRTLGAVLTLAHVLAVVGVMAAEPVAGLLLGSVFALFWGSILGPPWLRDRRSVVAADIRPGPPPVLVLLRRSGRKVTLPLDALTELRPLTVGHRSVDSSGSDILELRFGSKAYRTRAAFNPPANDVRLLEDALAQACPRARVHPRQDRTTWVSDSG